MKKRKKLSIKDENRIITQAIRDVFTEDNEGIVEEGTSKKIIMKDPPQTPPFPIFIFQVAIFKDILDAIIAVGTILSFGALAISYVLIIPTIYTIFFIWMLNKTTSGGRWKKIMIKLLWRFAQKRLLAAAIIESIPVINIIPSTTIFILMVYYEEKKIVKLINKFLEKLHNKGF